MSIPIGFCVMRISNYFAESVHRKLAHNHTKTLWQSEELNCNFSKTQPSALTHFIQDSAAYDHSCHLQSRQSYAFVVLCKHVLIFTEIN